MRSTPFQYFELLIIRERNIFIIGTLKLGLVQQKHWSYNEVGFPN